MLRFLLLLSLTTSAWTVTFTVQPIEQQIKESDGLLEGNFLKKRLVTLENGTQATQMIFKMNKEVGLQSDFYGMDEVIVHYPSDPKIQGLPEFVSGERVVLFIRNVDNRYWGFNLGFGTFKVINYGKEVMLVNSVFPQHPQVGQVSWDYFEKAVRRIKGSSLKIVQTLELPLEPDEQSGRALGQDSTREPAAAALEVKRNIASDSTLETPQQEPQPSLPVFWLVMGLGFFGGIFRLNNRRTHK